MRLIIIYLLIALSTATEVDNLNLLLPELKQLSLSLPQQLITAQGGCYTWKSSLPSILTISPHETQLGTCSKQALVQVAVPGNYPTSLYVTATDTATQAILNIPVRIRRLNKISIVTKSRMMNIREIQKLQLFAYDSDDNTFTSLEGLKFSWRLEQRSNIIETVPLDHAQLYLPLKVREQLEKKGFQSDLLVVRALAPGNLKIHVKCLQAGYENLHDQITLSVHQRFQLKPGPTIMMAPDSSYQLYLERPSQQKIYLPQPYYNIISSDHRVIVNSTLYVTVPPQTSKYTIRVEDTRTIPPYSSNVTIIVENPTSIKIVAAPYIIVEKYAPFQVQIYSGSQQLYGKPQGLIIKSDFALNLRDNTIVSSRKMTGSIKAQFKQLNGQILVTSFLPVRPILPTTSLHLPLDQTFKLRILGGSGLYDYFISNQIGIISNLGELNCRQVGQANITIVDRSHSANKAIIQLKVSNLVSIKSLDQLKQVNRDQWGFFYIIGKNNQSETFTQCFNSQFSVSVPSTKLQIDKKVNFTGTLRYLSDHSSKLVRQSLRPTSLLKNLEEEIIDSFSTYIYSRQIQKNELRNYIYALENYGICQVIRFRSLVSLQDRALISLIGFANAQVKLPLRVYDPIVTTIEQDQTIFLMTPSSSLQWKYNGGSFNWPGSTTKYFINNITSNDQKPIIKCSNKESPSTTYELKLQNQQTSNLLFPVSQKSLINVICKYPKKLQLWLQNGDAFDQIFIHPNAEVVGSVQPLDQSGIHFYNSSNVEYGYDAKNGVIQAVNRSFLYKAKQKNDNVKIYCEKLKDKTTFPKVELEFSVSTVQPLKVGHLLYNKTSQQASSTKDLKKHIPIVTLFTPKKPYILNLTNISPLFQIKCTDAVSCDKKQNLVYVNLLKVGKGSVSFRDKRVYGSVEWIYQFLIVQVDEVTVSGERDSIQKGQSVNVTVNNYFMGGLISPLLYEDNYIQLLIDRNLKVLQQYGNKFLIKAQDTGLYEIYGEQGYPKTIKSKRPFVLNVYEKIQPDFPDYSSRKQGNIIILEGQTTVIVGCRRILRLNGGPKSMQIHYKSHSNQLQISQTSSNTFSINGKKQGSFPLQFNITNHQISIALVKITVIVSKIQSIQLVSINQPVVGAQFRILPKFKVGQHSVEGCVCQFEYQWTTGKGLVRLGQWTTFGFLAGGGINATALSVGSQLISFQIKDKIHHELIGKAQKYITILSEINYNLPTLIEMPNSISRSLLLPPQSGYFFPKQYRVQSEEGIVKIEYNKIQSFKKTGQTTIRLIRENYRPEIIEIQVLPISGIFIGNDEGFISLQPEAIIRVPIYLQDNYGRLFITPIINLQLVISSNTDILIATLLQNGKQLQLRGVKSGNCILNVALNDGNVQDTIVVSVGSQIIPAFEVNILKDGLVKYAITGSQIAKWTSSSPKIASINQKSGLAQGLSLGRSKISNGEYFGWINVLKINRFQQIQSIQFSQNSYKIIYKAIWITKKGEQQLPHLNAFSESINNNFKPLCQVDNRKYFEIFTQLINKNGLQRVQCIVSIREQQPDNLPSQFTVVIKDSEYQVLGKFTYSSLQKFLLNKTKKNINLTSKKSRQTIKIKTLQKISIIADNGNQRWLQSSFNLDDRSQTITIDMSNKKQDYSWQFSLSTPSQTQTIRVSFIYNGQVPIEDHNFLSLSLDWPDYLIILMALIFGAVCVVQYYSEQKFKNT